MSEGCSRAPKITFEHTTAMRTKRAHGLKRVKVRQTWNKYNLYNLSRLRGLYIPSLTHYQQKWKAKAMTRAYHGEQIREKKWQRMFSPRLRSVIPMDHRYLAAFDGSEQARGRGSGREMSEEQRKNSRSMSAIPYMQMTYAPAERRLDTAVFRALFASSARQARQFVVHGAVKVNGKKMIHPSYQLNPGDMFQVDPERVMFATGAPKDSGERAMTRRLRREASRAKLSSEEAVEPAEGEAQDAASSTRQNEEPGANSVQRPEVESRASYKVDLQELLKSAKAILSNKNDAPRAKQKQALRQLATAVRKTIGDVNRKSVQNLDDELSTFMSQLKIATTSPSQGAAAISKPENDQTGPATSDSDSQSLISDEDRIALREAMREARENPIDPTKPYATPWYPRPYMSAFAFIPRYLEVNQNICSAVYLRHPVARPGMSEVPTPFNRETSQLAFTWYLRRR